jgi:hypothetical protein
MWHIICAMMRCGGHDGCGRERWYGWVGHGASWRLKNRYIKIPLLWVDADDDACPGHRRYAHFTTGKQVIYVPRWCSQCGPRATSLISQAEQARTMFQKLLLPTSNNVLGVLWKTKGNSDKSLSKFVFTHSLQLKYFGSCCVLMRSLTRDSPSVAKPQG